MDNKLSWAQNTDSIIKKTKSRMYCLRKLKSFNIDQKLLQMFYLSTVNSVLTFGLACWGGNINSQDRDRLDKIIKRASGVVGKKQDDISSLRTRCTLHKMREIQIDKSHPLHDEYDRRHYTT